MKRSFKWSQISAFRLRRHHLEGGKRVDLVTVCQDVCGIQAQLMASAEIALWARNHNLTRSNIRSALFERRRLVRTSCMRQTLHLIPASDFFNYISALKRSRVAALRRMMFKYSGMTQKDTEVLNEALLEALRDGPMTQRELTQEIASKVGKNVRKWMELAWSIQIFRLALVEGLICYGAERGKKMTFVRVDQWLPKRKKVDEQEAKQILLRRYLSAYGPATPQDFSKWSGIPMIEAREIWKSLDGEVIEVSIEDKKGSMLSEDYGPLRHSDPGEPSLHLLPSFDPYLLGHAEKNHLVSEPHYKSVYRNQGWISPAVLLNGRVIGIWSNDRKENRPSLTIEPFEKLSKTLRAKIEEEVAGLGDFLERSFEIRFAKKNHGG